MSLAWMWTGLIRYGAPAKMASASSGTAVQPCSDMAFGCEDIPDTLFSAKCLDVTKVEGRCIFRQSFVPNNQVSTTKDLGCSNIKRQGTKLSSSVKEW